MRPITIIHIELQEVALTLLRLKGKLIELKQVSIDNPQYSQSFTTEEVSMALKDVKSGKAPTPR